MSLSAAQDARGHGYQAVPLPRRPGDESVLVAQLARRACPRPSRRAVLYVHCLTDPYVQPDLAGWYLQRGFHSAGRGACAADRGRGDRGCHPAARGAAAGAPDAPVKVQCTVTVTCG